MYISEIKLRKLIRKELIKEASFWDNIVSATPLGMIGKAAHDLYYDTLGGEIEVGRLPWESNSTDIQKMKWGSTLLLGSDEKSAVPVILVGKRKPTEYFILKAGKAKPEDMNPMRDTYDNRKYVEATIKMLDQDASEATIEKTLEALASGQLYYAADTSTLFAPLSDDEKAGLSSFMSETGIEAGGMVAEVTAGAFLAAGMAPLATVVKGVGDALNVADVFNKLDNNPPNYLGAAFAILGLIPGGDLIGFLNKIGKLKDTFPASLADDVARAIIKILEDDFKNTVTEIVNSYIEDRKLDSDQANPLIQGIMKGGKEIAAAFDKIAKAGDTKIAKD